MMGQHLNQMRQAAQAAGEGVQYVRTGTIIGYNPDNYTAKVQLEPDGQPTGWLPIGAIGVGDGFGVQVAPNLGDVVDVALTGGSMEAGSVSLRFFTDAARPVSLQAGQILIKHMDGSFIKFIGGGVVQISAATELDVTAPVANVTATTSATITTATASVVASTMASITAPVINLAAVGQTLRSFVTDVFTNLFNTHTHPTGGPNTGFPNQTMGSTHVSSTVKGA